MDIYAFITDTNANAIASIAGATPHQTKSQILKGFEYKPIYRSRKELYRYARINDDLFELLKDKHSRDALRNILITRYLSKNI